MTSDVFTKKYQEEDTIEYGIIGNGTNFTFSSRLYDPQTAERKAIERARTLNCSLYRRFPDGRIFKIYPEKERVDKKMKKELKAYPEMMSNNDYVPGIQANVF